MCCRLYAVRKVRDSFKEKKLLTDPPKIEQEYNQGLQSLQMLKRQVGYTVMFQYTISLTLSLADFHQPDVHCS